MIESKVLLSIVTYNSKYIFNVLDNLKTEFSNSSILSIIIFDNNSEEEYKQKLKSYQDFVDIHFHDTNEGFGFGHNYNLLNATQEYFLVFNPDVIIKKETVEELIIKINSLESIGMAVPKVLNPDGSTQHLVREKVSVLDYGLRFVPFKWIKKVFDKRLATYECRNLSNVDDTFIRIGSGCCMLIKNQAFKSVNGFDSRYFMYFEDYDFCLELEKKDYQIIYAPQCTITHFYAKEAHKNFKLFKIFMFSMVKFFNKWGWRFF